MKPRWIIQWVLTGGNTALFLWNLWGVVFDEARLTGIFALLCTVASAFILLDSHKIIKERDALESELATLKAENEAMMRQL